MKKSGSFINKSLYFALLGALIANPADAGIRVGNLSRSYADAYNQVNAQRAQANYINTASVAQPAEVALPIQVDDADLANQITSGNEDADTDLAKLNACSMIYPDGEFSWSKPTIGNGAGGANTCTAIVELRGYQMGENGSDLVLARANLAAGDTFICNISNFPEATYTVQAGQVVFPADQEPTTDDVIKVMNEEQKQNAGIKIAAGAILGGLAGNFSGENDVGNDSAFGTDKGKLQNTAIGALSGAALMAGNTYAGKVGGDIILSTGVNAAAGGAIGNIMASVGNNSVYKIADCTVGDVTQSCLWGVLQTGSKLDLSGDDNYKTAFFNLTDRNETIVCDKDQKNCTYQRLISVKIDGYDEDVRYIEDTTFANTKSFSLITESDGTKTMQEGQQADSARYAKITYAEIPSQTIPAVIVGVQDKAFGFTNDDWANWLKSHSSNTNGVLYGNNNGTAYPLEGEYSFNNFYPSTIDAEDGGIIDLNNQARLKGTLIGAGTGGAMGAFVAYQGAQSEIQERWVSAVREYKDSLQKFYCVTGTHFLGFYNDAVIIPNMNE